jgi:hypothetical protein
VNLFEKAKQWANGVAVLSAWLGSGAPIVFKSTAQSRGDVCTGRLSGNPCSKNVKEYEVTEAISKAIKEQVTLKSKLELRILGEKSLFTCSGCGCPLPLKIWIPVEKLGLDEDELKNFPDFCWMKKEFQQIKK